MPSLKSLKNRISSVKSTQKITKAMKMVAASKLRRAQERAEGSRPYATKIAEIINNLSDGIPASNRPALMSGRFRADGSLKKDVHLLIVTSSDRGLCGGFNSSLLKSSKAKIQGLIAQGVDVKLITVGKKARESFKSYSSRIIASFDATKGKQPEFDESNEIGKLVIELFEEEKVDTVEIIYSKFINPLVQEVTFKSLIPLQASDSANDNKQADASNATYEYEPSEEAILDFLIPKNISVQIYGSILENAASEQGARMTAMDNATKNAGEMIGKLTLVYNRTRQATITKELIEIISGAEAL